jgi:cytochrome c556
MLGRKIFARITLVAAAAALTMPLLAAPADDVAKRVSGMRAMGGASRALNQALQAPEPDMAAVKAAAKTIGDAGRDIHGWFPVGSGPDAGVTTSAKPEIWGDAAGFKAKADAFSTQALAVEKAAESGSVDSVKAEIAKLGATCGGCHTPFRVPRT